MTKVVINKCFGGFGLSKTACNLLAQRKKLAAWTEYEFNDIERDDPDLVATVEYLGESSRGKYSHLVVADVPPGRYRIDEYDGRERIIHENDDKSYWKISK